MNLRRTLLTSSALSLVLAASSVTPDVQACGGLFCDSANPVNQAAERIIFAQNDDGTVTAAIEILYEGSAAEFAWVLPVPPGKTDVGVSSSNALDRLEAQSNPRFQLNQSFEDNCGFGDDSAEEAGEPGAGDPNGEDDDGIRVVAEGNAGPYTYKQLMVDPDLKDPADVAVTWLEANDFDVTQLGPKLLGKYLEEGMNLLAFKLQKGKDAGSIRPVLLTYKSKRPFIPIKPTAISANDDMGIKVWVLGNSRAIPKNYPHLELNQSLINWFNPNSNYNEVVIAAANEVADGQGFVTEQSGPAGDFAELIYQDFEGDRWERLRTGKFASLEEFLQETADSFADYDGFNDVFLDSELVPIREGATHEQLLGCIRCYFQANVPVRNEAYPETDYPGEDDPIHTLDVTAFLDKFYTLVIEPLEKTRAMFESHASVTRFYTTLSADEMTVDPVFDFNPELPDISNVHTATQILACEEDGWRMELPGGITVKGSGRDWPISMDDGFPVNIRVVKLGTEGDGDVVEDNAGKIAELLTNLDLGSLEGETGSADAGTSNGTDDEPEKPGNTDDVINPPDRGCGCVVAPRKNSSMAWLGLLGLALLRRVRRYR